MAHQGLSSLRARDLVVPSSSAASATGPVAVATATQRVAYRIAWTFVSTGTNPGDNALMGKTVSASFTWEMQ